MSPYLLALQHHVYLDGKKCRKRYDQRGLNFLAGSRQHTQARAYTPVSSSYRHDSPSSDHATAAGYDSDGIFNGPPATTAAHHSSPRGTRSGSGGGGRTGGPWDGAGGSGRASRSYIYGGIPAAPESGAGGAGHFSGFDNGGHIFAMKLLSASLSKLGYRLMRIVCDVPSDGKESLQE